MKKLSDFKLSHLDYLSLSLALLFSLLNFAKFFSAFIVNSLYDEKINNCSELSGMYCTGLGIIVCIFILIKIETINEKRREQND